MSATAPHRLTDALPVDSMRRYAVNRWQTGSLQNCDDWVAEEVPVALVYNGISHAVMLATPQDLEEFALGFSLSEGIIHQAEELLDLEIQPHADGLVINMRVTQAKSWALKMRRRSLSGRTGCGICGQESLDQLAGSPPPILSQQRFSIAQVLTALERLQNQQPLFAATGAVHAAAWCDAQGAMRCLREDVGRHNALDKVIGACALQNVPMDQGMILMTSRASHEIVQKAAVCGVPLLATISGPTGMAIRLARQSGQTLVGFARDTRLNIYAHAQRII